MREYIINIHPNELLRKKLNSLELMKIKKIKKKDYLQFLPNNIITRIFKELKKKYKNDYQ